MSTDASALTSRVHAQTSREMHYLLIVTPPTTSHCSENEKRISWSGEKRTLVGRQFLCFGI